MCMEEDGQAHGILLLNSNAQGMVIINEVPFTLLSFNSITITPIVGTHQLRIDILLECMNV